MSEQERTVTNRPVTAELVNPGFGVELRRYRTAAGLTLRSLAERVTFDFSYLAQVERGERIGSVRLAHRCDKTLDAKGHLIRLFIAQRSQQRFQRRPPGRQERGRSSHIDRAVEPKSPP